MIAEDGFKYLGLYITKDLKLFYTANLQPPLQWLRHDVEHWKALPLSLLGRAALFKMMLLPRFLYILYNAPDMVPAAYFKAVENAQRALVWGNSPPRIAISNLVQSWYDGGIGLPNIKKYYWASQLTSINHWIFKLHEDPGYAMDRWLLPGSKLHESLIF